MKKLLIVSGACLVLFFSCTHDKAELLSPAGNDCANVNAGFAADVLPIIQAKCQGCHGTGSTSGPGALTNYAEIKNVADRILSSVTTGSMPLNATPLPAAEVSKIRCWVNAGTPNN